MNEQKKILIVDDAELNRSLLADILSDTYETLEACDGADALAVIKARETEISLVLLDIVMPRMDGFEVLQAMRRAGLSERIPVIIISAETSSGIIDRAYDLGAVEYISRPFDEKTVKHRVDNVLMLYAKQKQLEDLLTEQVVEKEKGMLIMLETLSHIVEFRNHESGPHVLHIRVITETLLRQLVKKTDAYGLNADDIALIANASAMHDVGKITIPARILNKPGRLTPEEFEVMKTHSAVGAEMLEKTSYYPQVELIRLARDICRWHHERYDGGGYPDGLEGENIPIAAQVVALADVYDALTNERVYKRAIPHDKAVEMILQGACGSFNPLLLECLTEVTEELNERLLTHVAGGVNEREIQDLTRSLLKRGHISNRTLSLLEQERTKYRFFAAMSNEIQFEYVYQTEVLTISEWGASKMGIRTVLPKPLQNPEVLHVMSEIDLVELVKRIRQATPNSPVVSSNCRLNEEGKQRWYKVVARPLWVDEQGEEMTGVIGKFVDIHEERQTMDRLREMAQNDPLTGLFNRTYAREVIEARLAEGKGNFALMLFDLDYFKAANDRFGHLFGDRVLTEVGSKLRSSSRKSDVVARIGGDEFLLFLEYEGDVMPLAERIFGAVGGQYEQFALNASMGIALAPQDGVSYEVLFHHADQALDAAKKEGRRTYKFWAGG